MSEIDFNSNEWRERFKDRTPEEIAEIVGNYYEEKYAREGLCPAKRLLKILFYLIILIFIFTVVYKIIAGIARQ